MTEKEFDEKYKRLKKLWEEGKNGGKKLSKEDLEWLEKQGLGDDAGGEWGDSEGFVKDQLDLIKDLASVKRKKKE